MSFLQDFPFKSSYTIGLHKGSKQVSLNPYSLDIRAESCTNSPSGDWEFSQVWHSDNPSTYNAKLTAKRKLNPIQEVAFGISFQDSKWSRANYEY